MQASRRPARALHRSMPNVSAISSAQKSIPTQRRQHTRERGPKGDGRLYGFLSEISMFRPGKCLFRPRTKKPTWRNTRRYSTTSAYSLTSPPKPPGCSLSSHPMKSIGEAAGNRAMTPPLDQSYVAGRGIQQGMQWALAFSPICLPLIMPLGRLLVIRRQVRQLPIRH
jgi:hypothetical protein